jgi:hypothetical protein
MSRFHVLRSVLNVGFGLAATCLSLPAVAEIKGPRQLSQDDVRRPLVCQLPSGVHFGVWA